MMAVDFDRVFELFTEHLYGDETCFVRELVANAHDAIRRRPSGRRRPPSIRIRPAGRYELVISDDGDGMTRDQLRGSLLCIGSSDPRGTSQECRIGRFGVGFMSVFHVAERVVVTTRTETDPTNGACQWTWRRSGPKQGNIQRAARTTIGTTVRIRLRSPYHSIATDPQLEAIVRKWFPFVDVPILVGAKASDPRTDNIPWRGLQDDSRCEVDSLQWLQLFGDSPSEHCFAFPLGSGSGAVVSLPRTHVQGRVRVHSQGVLVSDDDSTMIPPDWRWVDAVLSLPAVPLTLSRSELRPSPACERLRDRIGTQLSAELRRLAHRHPTKLAHLLRDRRAEIARLVRADTLGRSDWASSYPFVTTQGLRTVEELYSAATQTDDVPKLVCSLEVPGADARWGEATACGDLVVLCCGDEELRLLEGLAGPKLTVEVMTWTRSRSADAEPEAVPSVRDYVQQLQHAVEHTQLFITPAKLRPRTLPGLVEITAPETAVTPSGSSALSEIDRQVDSTSSTSVPPSRLLLNGDSELLRNLAELDPAVRPPDELILGALLALGLGRNGSSPPSSLQHLAERLLEQGVRSLASPALPQPGDNEHTVCFFAHDFSMHRRLLAAIRAILEHSPYYWEVRSAEGEFRDRSLFDNVVGLISGSDFLVADVSSHNPNVLIEVGLALGRSRDGIVLLADRNKYRPCANLAGQLFVSYDSTELDTDRWAFQDKLRQSLRQALAGRTTRGRGPFLGLRLLVEDRILTVDERDRIEPLLSGSTELLATRLDQLAARAEVDLGKLQRAKQALLQRSAKFYAEDEVDVDLAPDAPRA